MPIKIPNDLPAVKTLESENIFIYNLAYISSRDSRQINATAINDTVP